MSLQATTSQTVGPYFSIGLSWLDTDTLAGPETKGERVTIRGRVVQGDGAPVSDAVVEVWQANAQGKYAHPEDRQDKPLDPAFKGFGRVPTDGDGVFRFTTIKPGRVPAPDGGLQAPHLLLAIAMRGLLRHLVTRIYFPDESSNAEDPVLRLVPAERRNTLIAKRSATDPSVLEWNVMLQGPDETVFFDY